MALPALRFRQPPRAVAIGALLVSLAVLILWLVSLGSWLLPDDPGEALQRRYGATALVDRHGQTLRWLYGPDHTRAQPVPLSAVSDKLVRATILLEDQRFWLHPGVDPLAVVRAAGQNLARGRRFSGASTLTQQLVKQMTPRPRSWPDKVVESLAALQLERHADKRQILGWYLNWAPYGGLVRGVEAAALGYFGVPARDLSWAQAAYLAVLPRAPGRLDPLRHPQRALPAQRRLLHQLHAAGDLDAQLLQAALAEPIRILPQAQATLAPHLADTVRTLLPQIWQARPLRMHTTLDAPLQDAVARLLQVHLAGLVERRVGNGAVVVLDNQTGEVRAMVGSSGYGRADRLGANNGALTPRQPGSTIKAFAFAAAFAEPSLHLTPASLLLDWHAHFATEHGDYAPRNYGDTVSGPLRARVALASSVNIASVRLAERLGVAPLLALLRALGLQQLDRTPDHYGLGLVLGDGEVTLLDLTAAFAALARLGDFQPPHWLHAIELDTAGPIALSAPPAHRVLPAAAAFQVLDILADPLARQLAFGRGGPLELPFPVAAKTGTSKGFRDNWALGATPDWTVGVWVGNFDGTPMRDVSGVTGAAPLLRAVLLELVGTRLSAPFAPPAGLQRVAICPVSGGAPTELCPTRVSEWLPAGLEPAPCTVHQHGLVDRDTGLRAGPGCPPAQLERQVLQVWPPEFSAWARAQGLLATSPRCPLTDPGSATLVIDEPFDGATYQRDAVLPAQVQQIALSGHGASRLQWLVDGEPLATAAPAERVFWTPPPGRHVLVLRDDHGREARAHIDVLAP